MTSPAYRNWEKRLEYVAAGIPPKKWPVDQVATTDGATADDCGFYRLPIKEKQSNGQWKLLGYRAVALLVRNGQLQCLIDGVPQTEADRDEKFLWFVSHPITEATYRAVAERGEPWPDFPRDRTMSLYKFWIDSLAGLKPPIVNEVPECGFYRMRRGTTWVPVAVWKRDGENMGFKFGGEVVDTNTGVERWPSYAAHPITEAEYRRVAESGLDWSDADPVVTEILAKPTAPRAADVDPFDDINEQAQLAIKGVDAYLKIEGEEANAKAAGLRNMLLKLSGDADKTGKALYDPHYRKYKELYDRWSPLVKLLDAAALKVRKAMERYQDDKREAAKKAQERAEAERERIAQAARDAATQAQIDGQPAPEPVELPPVAVQSNMAAPDVQVKPTFGKAAGVGTRMVVTGIDAEKVLVALKARAEWGQVESFLLELSQKLANKGIILPGVTAEEKSAIK